MANLNIERFYKSFPTLAHKRNRFPFEKEINWNMKLGEITPICAIRAVPGQTYNFDMSTVIKVAPLSITPMDNLVAKFFAFYNPDRNTWKNYKYWFGEKQNPENPEEEPTYLVPKVTAPNEWTEEITKIVNEKEVTEEVTHTGFSFNSFYDNIGCVPNVKNYKIDAFLPRTDRQVYNVYFRNQTLENPLPVNNGDEDDDPLQNMKLRKICKPRDLFTQCLPTKSGTTPVEIPLGTNAPVIGNGTALGLDNGKYQAGIIRGGGQLFFGPSGDAYGKKAENTNTYSLTTANESVGAYGITSDPNKSGLIADLSKAMGAPLEGLYQAVAYNTFQYLTSRGGNRYFEHISNIYGTVNPDGVLQQPEFLGSLSQMIDFDTVTQTSSTASEPTPLGNRSANGYMENYGGIINKSFGEFGWIIIYGVVTHYPKYQQGVSKLMQTDDPLELFNPIFNLMGDEAIYRSEIYIQPDDVVNEEGNPVNDEVFGYGKRNSRLLYPVNEIHGEQRSNYPQSLDAYHFGQDFSEAPTLNKEFDKVSDESFKRALTVTDETQFICNSIITGTQDIEIPIEAIPNINPMLAFNN